MNKEAFFKITYGLYIITSTFEGKDSGYVANTVFQVTSSPAKFAISCSKDNYTNEIIQKSGVFAFSILKEDYDNEIMSRFGYHSSRDTDKFEGILQTMGKTGAPIIKDDCVAWFECEVEQQMDLGSHVLYIGKLIDNDMINAEDRPLTYDYYHKVKRGLAPKNAPTFIEKESKDVANDNKVDADTGIHICDVCGYEYDPAVGDPDNGIPPGTAFEDLPDDWTCPTCGAEKEFFS